MPGIPSNPHALKIRRMGIDTHQEPVIYMRADCHICRSEGFESQSRVLINCGGHVIIGTLNVVTDNQLLSHDEAGLSDAAWRMLRAHEGDYAELSHPEPLESLSHVRAKVYGQRLEDGQMTAIVRDIAAGRYSELHLSAFVTACAGNHLDLGETVALTRAMVEVGERMTWSAAPVVDKHCVGGLPGNRTTLLVVPIIAAYGLTMPKTSSRAITSPAGTADTMEMLAPVNLDIHAIRRVVEREGGCIVWGGAVRLSPADDILIRVERPLELDSAGQMVASVLSKKLSAGSSHVVIDIPVGPTAKVRNRETARALSEQMIEVGRALGLDVCVAVTDGSQPVGRGIGPALEARDALAVLRGDNNAPQDLRERSLALAGEILELATNIPTGTGYDLANAILSDGRAWKKFQAICEAQGGMREPPRSRHTHTVTALRAGCVTRIDNRRLSRIAKLAGAPTDPAAGLDFFAPLGSSIEADQPLFTIHAESPGELAYAREYLASQKDIVVLGDET
ncbi:MAG TPA: thymidine phosphorylase family protein [Burkholderiales bacterium]|nr:thymidine phosphorylase family protein [Burkholderiales bacterium]